MADKFIYDLDIKEKTDDDDIFVIDRPADSGATTYRISASNLAESFGSCISVIINPAYVSLLDQQYQRRDSVDGMTVNSVEMPFNGNFALSGYIDNVNHPFSQYTYLVLYRDYPLTKADYPGFPVKSVLSSFKVKSMETEKIGGVERKAFGYSAALSAGETVTIMLSGKNAVDTINPYLWSGITDDNPFFKATGLSVTVAVIQ